MNKVTISILVVIVLALGIGGTVYLKNRPGPLDEFAQCLKKKNVVFYGAFWCPHCQNTKQMFGRSARLLPYVECSTPDGQAQNETCNSKGIKSYPTWIFPDGTRLEGEQSLSTLADKSGCPLPAGQDIPVVNETGTASSTATSSTSVGTSSATTTSGGITATVTTQTVLPL
jgi:thiol-disulfide isomerase/thioredoxin